MISGVRTETESVNRLKRLWEHKPNLLKRIFFGLELDVEEIKKKSSEYPTGKYCSGKFVLNTSNTQKYNPVPKEEIGAIKLRDFEDNTQN